MFFVCSNSQPVRDCCDYFNRGCIFLQVLVADKLDGDLDKPYIVVVAPLLLALFILVLLSFSAKGGNKCE